MTEFSLTETNVLDMAFYGQESLYRDCIAQVMRDDGWLVKTEVRTKLGIADLVARRDTEIWVIEAKLFGDNNSVAHACGQLLFYTDELRFTKRLIAVPERLLFKFDSVLSYHGIDLFWFTPYSRQVNDLFKKESQRISKVHLPELEMQQQIKAVEAFMQACAGLAAALAMFEHAPNPATTSIWQKGIAAATDAAQAMRLHVDRRPELTVIYGDAA